MPLYRYEAAAMGKKTDPMIEDAHLFRSAVGEVKPVKSDRIPERRPPPKPVPQQRIADERRVLQDLMSDEWEPAELETGDELLFARAGLQHNVLRKLRRGHYSVGAELDLHGLTVPEARTALAEFLHHCRTRDVRCVRVIHGKGNTSLNRRPVLKGKVNLWLQQRNDVLAFASARPVDGGTGAVYVLLRKIRS